MQHKKIFAVLSLLLVVAAVGCSSQDATPTPQPTPTPTVQATPAGPTPTPLGREPDPRLAELTNVVRDFGAQLGNVDGPWKTFDESFDVWRHGLEGCDPNDRVQVLDRWVTDFRAVVDQMTAVSFPAGTSDARTALAAALQAEEEGLRSQSVLWAMEGDAAFAAYDSARTSAAILRQEAFASLAEVAAAAEAAAEAEEPPEPPPIADPTDVAEAQAALEEASIAWSEFHATYDEWRTGDGTCDTGAVAEALQQFVVDFGAIAGQADALVRPSVVRPTAERFITAATTQAKALDDLEESWEPYQAAAWDSYDELASQSALLRRQVRSSLDELEFQFRSN